MRASLQDAYLLHRRHCRETSLLLEVFSREHGLLGLIAKGALRGKSKGGSLQPFTPLQLSWSGTAARATLTDAELSANPCRLAGDALFCGFYLNELLLRLLPSHDPHPRLFDCYRQTLERLEQAERLEETLRFFELALLEEIGYGLALEQDAETGAAIRPSQTYLYQLEHGPVAAESGADCITGACLLGLRAGSLHSPALRLEAKRLMRRVLHHHLGGKPLKSRDLFKYSKSQA
jgi:DNA repair protein RecO (recombination protein O)